MENYKTFLKIWAGQFISILGTGITSFVLSVWIVQNSDTATKAIFVGFFNWIPVLIFAGIAGYVADKYNKKNILIGFDLAAAFTSVILLFLLITGDLNVYYIYALVFFSTICDVFQSPVNAALVPILVPEEKLQRANGLVSLTESIQNLVAPILGSILLAFIGLQNIIIIDISTFVISVIVLLTIPARLLRISTVSEVKKETSTKEELLVGFKFIGSNNGFLAMIIFFALLMFFVNSALITTPLYLVLYYGEYQYGIVLTLIGVASIASGIYATSVRKIERENLIKNMFWNLMIFNLALLIISFRDNFILVALGFCILFYSITLVTVSMTYIKQIVTPKEYMGRVSSVNRLLTSSLMPFTYIIIGLLLDKVLIPFYESSSSSGQFLKDILSDTAGLPYRLIFVMSFMLMTILTFIIFSRKSVKNLVPKEST